MTYHKTMLSTLAASGLFLIAACSSDSTTMTAKASEPQKPKMEKSHADYLKPGAAIEFSHNYDGKTEPGEIETFQVFVKGGSLTAPVGVQMTSSDGLRIYSDGSNQLLDIAEDAPGDLDHSMSISVGAQEPGRYYLKFIASTDQGELAPMMRAYGIAIQVGDQPYEPGLGKGMTAQEMPSGEKIITMQAKETIEN